MGIFLRRERGISGLLKTAVLFEYASNLAGMDIERDVYWIVIRINNNVLNGYLYDGI